MKVITINRNTQSPVNIWVEGLVSVSSDASKHSFQSDMKYLLLCIFPNFTAFTLGNDFRQLPETTFILETTFGNCRKRLSLWKTTFGNCRKRFSLWKTTFGNCRKRLSLWETTFGNCRKRLSLWETTFGNCRKRLSFWKRLPAIAGLFITKKIYIHSIMLSDNYKSI